jgi:hypothetical protein
MPFLGDIGSNALGSSRGSFGLAATESDDNVPRGTTLKIWPWDFEPPHEVNRCGGDIRGLLQGDRFLGGRALPRGTQYYRFLDEIGILAVIPRCYRAPP